MIADYRTALQLIWISSALNLIVPGAEVSGMSIGVCLVLSCSLSLSLSGSVSPLSLSLSLSLFAIYSHTHTHTDAIPHAHTRAQTHSELSIPLANKHKHIKKRLFLLANTLAQTSRLRRMSMVQSRHRPMKNACPLCVFHKKHSSGFHPHPGWKTTQEYQLRWQFGWQCRQECGWRGIWDPECHPNERVSVSPELGGQHYSRRL